MSSEKLQDQELQEVTGGYNGTIPAGGITFETYGMMALNRYYAADKNTNNVVWVFQAGMVTEYTIENFVIDTKNNTWKSTGTGSKIIITDYNDFHKKYPYMLNLRP